MVEKNGGNQPLESLQDCFALCDSLHYSPLPFHGATSQEVRSLQPRLRQGFLTYTSYPKWPGVEVERVLPPLNQQKNNAENRPTLAGFPLFPFLQENPSKASLGQNKSKGDRPSPWNQSENTPICQPNPERASNASTKSS